MRGTPWCAVESGGFYCHQAWDPEMPSFVHYAHESIDESNGVDDDDDDDVSESIILCASSQVGASSCDKDTKSGKHGGVVCSTFCCCLLPQCFKQISDGMEELTVITGVAQHQCRYDSNPGVLCDVTCAQIYL